MGNHGRVGASRIAKHGKGGYEREIMDSKIYEVEEGMRRRYGSGNRGGRNSSSRR